MFPIKNICTLTDLRKLEVINICDGRRMGCVMDLEFDLCLGNITAILVPKKWDWSDLFKKNECKFQRIPWCNIERIGDDTILVRVDEYIC